MTRRDRWPILYASLIFGGISTPYWYLVVYATQGFFSPLEYPDLFWLLVSTALLLIVFIARTPLEQRLAAGFGSLFPLLLVLLLVAAVADLMYITLLLEAQFLPAARLGPT